jgi:parallel beta-helix repeat protein
MKRRNIYVRVIIPSILLIFCLTLAVNTISADTVYVDGEGGGDFTKIQDAINASSSGNIIIINKTIQPYKENINVNKSLVIRGNIYSRPIIDGNFGIAFNISNNDSIIQNLVIINCTNNGSSGIVVFNPIKILQNISLESISLDNCSFGISIKNTSNITIKFCNVSNSSRTCLYLSNTSNGTINNLILHNSSGKGIYLENATYINISNSKISNISKNQSLNGTGIKIIISEFAEVFNNTISFCEDEGIFISSSSNVNLTKNKIANNSCGVKFNWSENNTVFLNEFSNNSIYGCFLTSSNNNTVYINTFINNTLNNSFDNGSNNWNNSTSGNYWDDYNWYDYNNDGIVKIPYNISGGNNQDIHPLGFFINHLPIANFTFSPSNPLTLNSVQFNDTSIDYDGNIVNWTWEFGDGIYSYQKNTTHTYSENGSYQINLTIKDNENGAGTISKNIDVLNTPPTAEANGPYSGSVNSTITFNASGSNDSDGTITGYRWDWDNDGTWDTSWLTINTTTHSYNSTGSYTVKLQVRDNDLATDNDTGTVTISNQTSNSAPTADAGGPYIAQPNVSITFDASESTDSDGTITGYRWDWDNDGTWDTSWLTINTTTHSYNSTGSYTVKLQVKDNENATDNDTATVTISIPSSNTAPTSNAGGPYSGELNSSISFSGSGSSDSDGIIVNYTWNFGDGSIGYGKLITHRYLQTGSFTVSLTIKDDDGATDIDYASINVYENILQPEFNFVNGVVYNDSNPLVNISYTEIVEVITALLNGNPINLSTSDNLTFNCNFSAGLVDGNYTLSITVKDEEGNIRTDIITFVINAGQSSINEKEDNSGGFPWFQLIFMFLIFISIGWIYSRYLSQESFEYLSTSEWRKTFDVLRMIYSNDITAKDITEKLSISINELNYSLDLLKKIGLLDKTSDDELEITVKGIEYLESVYAANKNHIEKMLFGIKEWGM